MDPVLTRHHPGQVSRPRRRADRVVAKSPVEPHPLARHSVDVGGFDVGISVTAEGPGPVVVGEDENDVGLDGGKSVATAKNAYKAEKSGGSFSHHRSLSIA